MDRSQLNPNYQPTTGARCSCRPGAQRDNCTTCEATGWVIDFAKLRAQAQARKAKPVADDVQ